MENLAQLAPLIILFPAIGAFINFFWGARMGEKPSAIVATVAAASSFVISVMLLLYLTNNNYQPVVVDPPLLDSWIRIDSVNLDIAWQTRVDTLSVSMMMFVTLVGTLIHIYAIGYMHGDSRFSRFFAYLNMFLVFMLILVSGNNLLMMFVGWEGVGLCSYLLIGFWWDKPNGVGWKNSNAARKAFIANRIGDFGVLMAIFLVWWSFGTLDFYKPGEVANPSLTSHSVEAEAVEDEGEAVVTVAEPEISYQNPEIEDSQLGIFGQAQRLVDRSKAGEDVQLDIGPFTFEITTLLVIVTLFMLLGATGKSAQIPLFVWLPDAMAGPTPVSALIHAATMVTAGVYMMVRTSVFFYNAELTSFIVAMVGAGTAVVAGFVAIAQFDIKRVLAYSTISQLGFMVAAVGLGAYPAAMFHMITHAFFKALLFLGSGSVIHGVEHGHHHVHEHDGHGEEPDPEAVRVNPRRTKLLDLDSLPFPAYEKLLGFPQAYTLPLFNYPKGPGATCTSSRGCPYACSYCDRSVFKRSYRFNSAEYLHEHLKHLRQRFGVRHVNIYDDQFTFRRQRVEAFCQRMLSSPLGVSFNCAVRADHVDLELLRLLK
ncbi:MAG: proton-conducting transporter membrane subunit, partial [Phototrophicaceae bacterium]